MNKKLRAEIKNKYDNKCSYCGCELADKFHVDHIKPKNNGGQDIIENYNPSCMSCNIRKSTYSIDEFREQLKRDIFQMNRDSAKYRLLKRFGLIKEPKIEVTFYFETRDDTELMNDDFPEQLQTDGGQELPELEEWD